MRIGCLPFAATYERTAHKVEELPFQRRLGWLYLWFRVLPTDQRVRDLTPEQLDQLWRQFEHYHPDLVKKSETYVDPDFAEFEREVLEDAEGVLFDDVEVIPFEPEANGVILPGLEPGEGTPPDVGDEWEDV